MRSNLMAKVNKFNKDHSIRLDQNPEKQFPKLPIVNEIKNKDKSLLDELESKYQ